MLHLTTGPERRLPMRRTGHGRGFLFRYAAELCYTTDRPQQRRLVSGGAADGLPRKSSLQSSQRSHRRLAGDELGPVLDLCFGVVAGNGRLP
jgi:hypothetical protein